MSILYLRNEKYTRQQRYRDWFVNQFWNVFFNHLIICSFYICACAWNSIARTTHFFISYMYLFCKIITRAKNANNCQKKNELFNFQNYLCWSNFTDLPSPKRFKYKAHLRSSIRVSAFRINHISCFKPNRLWLSTNNRIKEIDEDGHLLRELSVNWMDVGYHTLTKAGDLLFKKDSDIYMLSSSGEIRNLHIHADELSCIYSSRLNGDIFVCEGQLITRYNDEGFQLQTISALHHIRERYLYLCMFFFQHITENINGDIIVSSVRNHVIAFKSNGQYKFTYSGVQNRSEFIPSRSGLCNDIFGDILVGNNSFYDPCVHLLDINGNLLAKLLTRILYLGLQCNALCVDEKNNLYVVYGNEINVYTYLSDTTIAEHDATMINSEIPCEIWIRFLFFIVSSYWNIVYDI